MGISSVYNRISGLGSIGKDTIKSAARGYQKAFSESDEATQNAAIIGLAGLGAVGAATALNMNNPLNLRK